ncbi:MAG: TonB-dependent receptor [Bacteroidales bacterium]|nr:TonB-dependent receptor [Bacteroidales bacterium]
MKKIVFLCLMMVFISSLYGQDSIKTVILDSVVIKGKNINLLQFAPSGDNINEKQLQTINSQNVGDAAKFLSGVIVKDYGGLGGIKTVSVRGLSSNHTAILYDGVNLFDNQSGQIDLSKYSLSSISSISLANSQFTPTLPTATSLASANSINIQTKRPEFIENEKIRENLSISYGSFNLFNLNNYMALKLKEKDILTTFINFTSTDGKYPYNLHYGNNQNYQTERLIRKNNDLFSYHLESNYFHIFNKDKELKMKMFYYYSDRGLPANVTLYYQNSKQRLTNKNFFFQDDYTTKINNYWKYKNIIKFDWNYSHYIDPNVFTINGGESDTYIQRFIYMNNAIAFTRFNNIFFTLTNDLSYNNLSSPSTLDDTPKRMCSTTAFVIDSKWKNIFLTADIVHSFSKDYYNNIKDTAKSHFSPFVSIKYKHNDFSTTFFYKNIFRMPTFNELYYRQVGNIYLRPEKTNQFGLSTNYSFNFSNISITPEIDLYYNDVTDKIVAIPQRNIFLWTMLNYGKVKITGIDCKINFNMFSFNSLNVNIKLNYSYQKAIDNDIKSLTYKQNLPYMPQNIFSSILTLDYKQFTLGYTCLFVDQRYSLSENTSANYLAPYSDNGANIKYKTYVIVKNKKINMDFMFSVNNILDKQYEIVKSYPMMGRNYNFKINIEL